jgi:cytochrome c biogenesis protein CcdA
MPGIDQWLSGFASGGATMALVVALLLGLRHATDPDHLTAVSTLVLADKRNGVQRARRLGLAWGLGHATTLFIFGLPIVFFRRYLPAGVLSAAEVAIGLLIIVLAVRLLLRWRRGYFHSHLHAHEGVQHAHPHVHERVTPSPHPVAHAHHHGEEVLGRSALAAYGIGLVHGVGGSAGVGLLLVGAMSNRTQGVTALILFAAGTAVSMALVSSAFAYTLSSGKSAARLTRAVPALGTLSFLFGAWYAWQALAGFGHPG